MMRSSLAHVALLSLLVAGGYSQVVLTGCHIHDNQEVCFLPGGAETTITDAASITPSPTLPSSVPAQTTDAGQTTAITECHMHDVTQYCVKGNGAEVQVQATATVSGQVLPTEYTGCHAHGSEMFCMTPDGGEVAVINPEAAEGGAGEGHDEHSEHSEEEGENCHFHAGVEHCTGGAKQSCERKDRDYNVPLRIGLLFVILATSGIAVYAPILMRKLLNVNPSGTLFTIVKQFGTGIIVATALIHLITHAELMFGNSCLGELKYEATATSIAMAGAFVAFLIEFIGHRLAQWRRSTIASNVNSIPASNTNDSSNEETGSSKEPATQTPATGLATLSHHSHPSTTTLNPNDALSVLVLEAGIIFHSLLLGITLVVAGDSVFITLFIVIVFHQMFEGLALGARIAAIDGLRKTKYILLPLAFTLVTPTGMAIGIGVLNKFNGNDPSTIIALGTLDSISAGILLWVGLVTMWAQDWIIGDLKDAPLGKTLSAGLSLVAGMALMGLLGKWA